MEELTTINLDKIISIKVVKERRYYLITWVKPKINKRRGLFKRNVKHINGYFLSFGEKYESLGDFIKSNDSGGIYKIVRTNHINESPFGTLMVKPHVVIKLPGGKYTSEIIKYFNTLEECQELVKTLKTYNSNLISID